MRISRERATNRAFVGAEPDFCRSCSSESVVRVTREPVTRANLTYCASAGVSRAEGFYLVLNLTYGIGGRSQMPSFPNRRVVGACAGPHCQTSRPSGAPPKYIPSAPAIAAPPVFRPAAPTVLRKQQAPPVYNRSAAAPNRSGVPGRRTIQRYCRNPNCNDPACTDESNHGHDRVYDLRQRTLYVSDLGTDGGVHRGTGTTQETRDAVNNRTVPV